MDEGIAPAISTAATTRENRQASVGLATGLHIEFSTATAEVTADGELNIGVTLSVFAASYCQILWTGINQAAAVNSLQIPP